MGDAPVFSTIHFDALLILRFPGVVPPKDTKDHFRHVYNSTLTDSEGRVLHIDITLAIVHPSTMLFADNTSAHVLGTAGMIGTRLSVTASSILRGPTGICNSELNALLRPVVLFGGVITGTSFNDGNGMPSGLQVVDITVKRAKEWPYAPIAITCKLDEDNEHVKSLENIDINNVVIISGILTGISHGKLQVTIHDIGLRDDQFVCTTPGLAAAFPCALTPVAAPCRWFANVIRRGLQSFHATTRRGRAIETQANENVM